MEDQSASSAVQAGDPDGTPVTVVIDSSPTKGTVTASGTGPITFLYTPRAASTGMDSFSYHVSDANGTSNTATVGITITPVPPVVANQSFSSAENGTINAQISMTGPAGESVALSITASAGHGTVQLVDPATGAFTYTPAADYTGPDSFQVKASDAVAVSATATVTVNVAAVDGPATANPDDFVVPATGTTMLDVLANDTDGEDAGLSISIVQQPLGAAATVSGNKIAFTPNPSSTGLTRFSYQLTDVGGAKSTALVRVVIGSMAPLIFLADNDTPGVFELYVTDHFTTRKVSAPLAAGEYIQGYESSANGKSIVYVSGTQSTPSTPRLWLVDLTSPGSAPTLITAPSTVTYLQISPDGSQLVFNGVYVNTAHPDQAFAIPSQGTVDHAIFSHDGRQIFYSVLLGGGGRVIDSTATNVQGLVGYTQLTQMYAVAEGLGIQFVSTPDDTKVVSAGLFSFPFATGPSQEAFVTPTSPPFSDRQLNPLLTNSVDSVSPPSVTPDSRYAYYAATIGGLPYVYANDLVQAGNAVAVDSAPAGWYVGAPQVAPDSRTLFYNKAPLNSLSIPFYYADLTQPGQIHAFSPLGSAAAAPRTIRIAPDESAVAFDSGTSVYLSSWGHFDTAALVVALGSNAGNPQFTYSPDSNGVAIAGEGTSPQLHVASPKTGDIYDVLNTSATGVRCFSFAGTGCWW
jgi:hypothetical protein